MLSQRRMRSRPLHKKQTGEMQELTIVCASTETRCSQSGVSQSCQTNDERPHHQGEVPCASKGEGNHAAYKLMFTGNSRTAAGFSAIDQTRRGCMNRDRRHA